MERLWGSVLMRELLYLAHLSCHAVAAVMSIGALKTRFPPLGAIGTTLGILVPVYAVSWRAFVLYKVS